MNKREKATKVYFRKELKNLLEQKLLEQKKQGFARNFNRSETKYGIGEVIKKLNEIPVEHRYKGLLTLESD